LHQTLADADYAAKLRFCELCGVGSPTIENPVITITIRLVVVW